MFHHLSRKIQRFGRMVNGLEGYILSESIYYRVCHYSLLGCLAVMSNASTSQPGVRQLIFICAVIPGIYSSAYLVLLLNAVRGSFGVVLA